MAKAGRKSSASDSAPTTPPADDDFTPPDLASLLSPEWVANQKAAYAKAEAEAVELAKATKALDRVLTAERGVFIPPRTEQKNTPKPEPEQQHGWKVGPCLVAIKRAFPEGPPLPSGIKIKEIGRKLGGEYERPSMRDTVTRAAKIFDHTFRPPRS